MRRRYNLLPLTALVAVFGVSACRRHDASTPSPLKLETKKFERSLPGCGDKDKREEPCVTFSVTWPEVTGGVSDEIKTKLNAAIMARLQPSDAPRGFEAEAAAMVDDYHKFRKEFPDAELGYFTRRQAEISASNASVLSIVINEEDFRGGAHPNSDRTYINLRPSSGEEIALQDLLAGGAAPKLSALVEKGFRRVREIDGERKLSDAGFHFADDKFTVGRTWGIDSAGLVFHYNPYEVAPYALGPTTVRLAWSELAGLLNPDAGIEPGRR